MARHDLAPLGVAIFAMGRPARQALDVLDVFWRANRRNMRLLRAWLDREGLV
jgi:hypothetical protein